MRFVCLAGCLSFAAVAWSQTTPTTAPSADQLIRQLGVDNWRQRQAAQDALVAMGDEATAPLAATTQSAGDEETRSRAAAALAQIAEDRLTGPTRITLHVRDASPQEAFARFNAAAHASLQPVTPVFWQSVASAPVSVDFDQVLFWDAMRVMSEKTGVYLQEWGPGLRLTNGPLFAGPQCVSGSFLVTADQIERNQSLKFGPAAEHEDRLSLSLMLMSEPKVRTVRSSQNALLTEAVDENGNSLLPEERAENDNAILGESVRWNCNVPLRYPKHNPGTRLVRLRGSFRVAVASRIEQLSFTKLTAAQTLQTATGVAVTASALEPAPASSQTRVTVTIASGRENSDLADQLTRPSAMVMLDADGRPLARESVQVNGNEKKVEVSILFSTLRSDDGARVGPPQKLQVQLITATKELSVPFAFSDLPLP